MSTQAAQAAQAVMHEPVGVVDYELNVCAQHSLTECKTSQPFHVRWQSRGKENQKKKHVVREVRPSFITCVPRMTSTCTLPSLGSTSNLMAVLA